MAKLNILGTYYKEKKKKENLMPKKGFYFEKDKFKMEWDIEEEKNG